MSKMKYLPVLAAIPILFIVWNMFSTTAVQTSDREAPVIEVPRFSPEAPIAELTQLAAVPHDTDCFTQGLELHGGIIYETCGHYKKSNLRKVDLHTGEVLQVVPLGDENFAEGLTIMNERVYVLTWREKTGFVFDLDLKLIKKFSYATIGWGLTHDGSSLIYTTGSHLLYFLHPTTFEVTRKQPVHRVLPDGRLQKVEKLNELECIGGYVYANIWNSNEIVIIEPRTGLVRKSFHVPTDWYVPKRAWDDVLNGIAFQPSTNELLLTGKLWPSVFRVAMVAPPSDVQVAAQDRARAAAKAKRRR